MFPKPSQAAVQAVVFDIGFGGRLSFHRPVGAQGANPTLLDCLKKPARGFSRTICAYLKCRQRLGRTHGYNLSRGGAAQTGMTPKRLWFSRGNNLLFGVEQSAPKAAISRARSRTSCRRRSRSHVQNCLQSEMFRFDRTLPTRSG
jgi:hypothetical protein